MPSKPPIKLKPVNSVSPYKIKFSWEPVPPEFMNGDLISYHVTYQRVRIAGVRKDYEPVLEMIVTETSVTLEKLEPFSEYAITVAAKTAKGLGPYAQFVYGGKKLIFLPIFLSFFFFVVLLSFFISFFLFFFLSFVLPSFLLSFLLALSLLLFFLVKNGLLWWFGGPVREAANRVCLRGVSRFYSLDTVVCPQEKGAQWPTPVFRLIEMSVLHKCLLRESWIRFWTKNWNYCLN